MTLVFHKGLERIDNKNYKLTLDKITVTLDLEDMTSLKDDLETMIKWVKEKELKP